jgi:hypothetical protein
MREDQPILGKPEIQRHEWKFDAAGIALEPVGAPGVHTFAGCAVRIRAARRISPLWNPRGPERFLGCPPRRAPDGHFLHGAEVEIEVVRPGTDLAHALDGCTAWKLTVVTEKESIAFPHAKLCTHSDDADGFSRAAFRADAEPGTLGAD